MNSKMQELTARPAAASGHEVPVLDATIGARLLEVLAAMLLAGAIFVTYNAVTSGNWELPMLLIVPISFMWSMVLGAMAASNIAMGLFLLLAALVILAVYLIAPLRPAALAAGHARNLDLLVQVSAQVVLFAMLQVTP